MREIKVAAVVLSGALLSGRVEAQLDPGTYSPYGGRLPGYPGGYTPGTPPKRWPSIWEGGTNLSDPNLDQKPGDGGLEAEGLDYRRYQADLPGLDTCPVVVVTLAVEGGSPGELSFVPASCDSPLAGQEIWRWPSSEAWPDRFEIRPDARSRPIIGPWTAWSFPSEPFALEQPGPWLAEVDPLPGDLLYEVERVDEAGAQIVAWFWFQRDPTWAQVAYADASLGEALLNLNEGGYLRFTAVDVASLPLELPVVRAAEP